MLGCVICDAAFILSAILYFCSPCRHVTFTVAAPIEPPVEVQIERKSDHSVYVKWRGVSTTNEEEPLEGYKVSTINKGEPLEGYKVSTTNEEEPLEGYKVSTTNEEEPLEGYKVSTTKRLHCCVFNVTALYTLRCVQVRV